MAYKEMLRVDISESSAAGGQATASDASPLGRDCPGIAWPDTSLRQRRWACPAKERSSARSSSADWRPLASRGPGWWRRPARSCWPRGLTKSTGDRLQLTCIQELLAERDCRVSYASLQRFVARRNWRRRTRATVRMEDTALGEVVEVDFGRLGLILVPPQCHHLAIVVKAALGHAAQVLKGIHMALDEGGRIRATHQLHVAGPGPAQGHHEHPEATLAAVLV